MSAIRKQRVPRPSAGTVTYMNISLTAANAKDPEAGLYTKRLNAWHEQGKQLATQGNSTVWETADWLLEAASFERRERWCYKEAAVILSLSVGCCRNYASVAKAFPAERRVTSGVTFAHHRVVVALPEPEQKRLLGAAAENRWTVGELGSEVRKMNGVRRKQKQYATPSYERVDKWYGALYRMTNEGQIKEASGVMQILSAPNRRAVAARLREIGARVTALAEQVAAMTDAVSQRFPDDEPGFATAVIQEEEMVTA